MAEVFSAQDYKGKRLKGDTSDAIYLVLDGKAQHIANPDVYRGLFGDGPITFETVSQGFFNKFPKGAALNALTPLIKGYKDNLDLIDDGHKRWISSPAVFKRYGFSAGKVLFVGSAFDLIPDGPDIS